MYDYIIIGGGIVGLATAWQLKTKHPHSSIAVLEKEAAWAAHQTGRNSGVIHSGIYYKPGSLKAQLAVRGRNSMIAFCQKYEVKHEVCGKIIVATRKRELPFMDQLYHRGCKNGLQITKLQREEVIDHEPYVQAEGGLYIPTTGIVDYQQVAYKLVELLANQGVELFLNTQAHQINEKGFEVTIDTNHQSLIARKVINCAGLHSDQLVKQSGILTDVKIIPFRGEYFTLKATKHYVVKNLVYPVPDPKYPFLGVHLTRGIHGEVHAGPNAVWSLKKEGYNKWDIDRKEALATLLFPGFWRLAKANIKVGAMEMSRSLYKALFVKSLQRFIPEIQTEDMIKAPSGVRAQAMLRDGTLLDDFFIILGKNVLHVCNAPSPAATASLEIGRMIAERASLS
ncbi:L-2-hydroxyglutarate oxidase [Virgibacillus dokdonensis]|uniref:L-2-hydroxyglutarate oxidase n=1 Tax=Virgibacillus dokdonensis TaxID=302167 RepID=A0ABU7VHU5_9BACI